MRTPDEVKLRANKLREIMGGLGYQIKHGESLEAISRLEGFADWNTYHARLISHAELLPLRDEWFATGDERESYEQGYDPAEKYRGQAALTIRSKPECKITDQSMSTVMQSIRAADYTGGRVRLSAKLKANSITGAGTIWLRVDGEGKQHYLTFDNLENRKTDGVLQGTTGWLERSIALDVPESAISVNFGFYLRGTGVVYAADYSLELLDGQSS